MKESPFYLALPSVPLETLCRVVLSQSFQASLLTKYPERAPNFEVSVGEWEESRDDEGRQRLTRHVGLSSPLDFAPQAVLRVIGVTEARSTINQVAVYSNDQEMVLTQQVHTTGVPLCEHVYIAMEYGCLSVGPDSSAVRGMLYWESTHWLKWVIEQSIQGQQLANIKDWQKHLQHTLAAHSVAEEDHSEAQATDGDAPSMVTVSSQQSLSSMASFEDAQEFDEELDKRLFDRTFRRSSVKSSSTDTKSDAGAVVSPQPHQVAETNEFGPWSTSLAGDVTAPLPDSVTTHRQPPRGCVSIFQWVPCGKRG